MGSQRNAPGRQPGNSGPRPEQGMRSGSATWQGMRSGSANCLPLQILGWNMPASSKSATAAPYKQIGKRSQHLDYRPLARRSATREVRNFHERRQLTHTPKGLRHHGALAPWCAQRSQPTSSSQQAGQQVYQGVPRQAECVKREPVHKVTGVLADLRPRRSHRHCDARARLLSACRAVEALSLGPGGDDAGLYSPPAEPRGRRRRKRMPQERHHTATHRRRSKRPRTRPGRSISRGQPRQLPQRRPPRREPQCSASHPDAVHPVAAPRRQRC